MCINYKLSFIVYNVIWCCTQLRCVICDNKDDDDDDDDNLGLIAFLPFKSGSSYVSNIIGLVS